MRAVENALGITVPDNARLMRNLIEGAQFIQDHVIHFYHLHAPDWVDVRQRPVWRIPPTTSEPGAIDLGLAQFQPRATLPGVRERLQTFVDSGQLGIFGNAYWGHPAYRLPPEGNLLAVAHYLEALDWQREYIKVHALLGGKNPHPQTYLVGGMSLPVDPNQPDAVNPARIAQLRNLAAQAVDFVRQVYLPDLLLVGSFYREWADLGAGPGHYLVLWRFPGGHQRRAVGAVAAAWGRAQ